MNDVGLVNALRRTSGLLAKKDIRSAAATFSHMPFPKLGLAGMLGDDSAVVPAQTGQLLLACEGMHPELVEEDPVAIVKDPLEPAAPASADATSTAPLGP